MTEGEGEDETPALPHKVKARKKEEKQNAEKGSSTLPKKRKEGKRAAWRKKEGQKWRKMRWNGRKLEERKWRKPNEGDKGYRGKKQSPHQVPLVVVSLPLLSPHYKDLTSQKRFLPVRRSMWTRFLEESGMEGFMKKKQI